MMKMPDIRAEAAGLSVVCLTACSPPGSRKKGEESEGSPTKTDGGDRTSRSRPHGDPDDSPSRGDGGGATPGEQCLTDADCAGDARCLNGADPDGDCPGATACDGTGKCYNAPPGSKCVDDSECGSGVCAQSVCCSVACSGTCKSCKGEYTGMLSGICANVKSGLDPNDECAGGLACNGFGKCHAKTGGDACTNGFECTSGECCSFQCTYGWQAMTTASSNASIKGIWGSGASKVWAITDTKVLVRNGATWDLADIEPLPAGAVFVDLHGAGEVAVATTKDHGIWLNSVFYSKLKSYGTGKKGVTAVWHLGSGALPILIAYSGAVLWLNGAGGNDFDSLFTPAGTSNGMGLWAGSPSDVYAGGYNNAFGPKAYHHDGQTWTDLKPPPDEMGRITAVTGHQGKVVFAWTALLAYGIATWDGSSWGKLPPMPNGLGAYTQDMAACGDRLYVPSGSTVAIYLAGTWTLESVPSSVDSVWCASQCSAFTGGSNGTIYRR